MGDGGGCWANKDGETGQLAYRTQILCIILFGGAEVALSLRSFTSLVLGLCTSRKFSPLWALNAIFIALFILGIILAIATGLGLGYGAYFGFFGWVMCVVGFFCAWKSINLGILIYLIMLAINIILQVIAAIICWVNAFLFFSIGAGWGILLIIYSIVNLGLAAFMAYMFWVGWQLFQKLGGFDNLGGGVDGKSKSSSGGGEKGEAFA